MQKLPMAMHDQCFYESHKYIIVMYIIYTEGAYNTLLEFPYESGGVASSGT